MSEEYVCEHDALPAQTLSGNAPISSGERVLQHGSDDHRLDADFER